MQEFLDYQLLGNSVEEYGWALLLFLGLYVAFRIFRAVVLKSLRRLTSKTESDFDDSTVNLLGQIPSFFYFVVALYFPLKWLTTSSLFDRILDGVFLVVVVFQSIQLLQQIIGYSLRKWAEKESGDSDSARHAFAGLKLVIKILLWTIGLLLILSNLGIDITTLVASLGIGGIAIALAMQNILSDIFSSFSIYFDKPFEVGDFIIIGEHRGKVKSIGLKTTRLQAIDGEELVVSNQELTSTRIQNFKKMEKRRVLFDVGVEYDHDIKTLRKAKELIESSIESVDGVEFDRVHLFELGDFSLDFRVVFHVLSQDYRQYMDARENVNFAILEAFNKAGINMAFPTQKMIVDREAAAE